AVSALGESVNLVASDPEARPSPVRIHPHGRFATAPAQVCRDPMATSVSVAMPVATVVTMTLAWSVLVAVPVIAVVLITELQHPALLGQGREDLLGGTLPKGGRHAVGKSHGDRL